MRSPRQSLPRPAAQEDIGHWAGSSPHPPAWRCLWLVRQDERRVSDPVADPLELMGLVGRCGSVVPASPQGEGGRKLSLSI